MNAEYFHASKFGNGAMVAAEFQKDMVANGIAVDVRHIKDVKPSEVPKADLYVFSSPGRFGKPIRSMRRFLTDLQLPGGARYGLLTTEVAPPRTRRAGGCPPRRRSAPTRRSGGS
jgi:hypothetical protein